MKKRIYLSYVKWYVIYSKYTHVWRPRENYKPDAQTRNMCVVWIKIGDRGLSHQSSWIPFYMTSYSQFLSYYLYVYLSPQLLLVISCPILIQWCGGGGRFVYFFFHLIALSLLSHKFWLYVAQSQAFQYLYYDLLTFGAHRHTKPSSWIW